MADRKLAISLWIAAVIIVLSGFSLLSTQSARATSITDESPIVYDARGRPLDHVLVGQQVTFSKTIFNEKDVPQPFLFLFEIRDDREFTHYVALQKSTLAAKSQVDIGASWIAEATGNHKLRTALQTIFVNPPPGGGISLYEHDLIVVENKHQLSEQSDSTGKVLGQWILADTPIGVKNIVKINDVIVREKRIKDPSFDLIVEPKLSEDGIGVTFKIVNVGDQYKAADIDGWSVRPGTSNAFEEKGVGADDNPAIKTGIIRSNESQVVMETDYVADEAAGWFEAFPGPHTLLLMGFNMEDWERFDQLEEEGMGEYEDEDRARFLLKVDVIIGFNEELLGANGNKLILANNTIMSIEGNTNKSSLFEITEDEPKTIIFNITNNYDYPASAMLGDPAIWIWHAQTATYEVLGGGEFDYFDDSCYTILAPGESLQVESVNLKKDAFPLGSTAGRGISMQLDGTNISREGLYVVLISGRSFSCMTDEGVELPKLVYTGAVAFEVK